MVIVPFTAIDNHCHSVTVGARLLTSETIESYTWLLQMLLKLFGSAPKVVVTDQDHVMKQAIAYVFPNTRHRLCMRHIMKKVADKAIMVEFDLDKNKWLTDMYENRFVWIPAFYRDEPLSGLMRTTSI
ncbi:protein FAR1-RELATED SEQUENCE 5-like [Bidens hawaiensis]|uniref:protein FAR1-RELATED SEQUENCE 5-like n=1 Tax=Bidens hawaiensis TaxID=980011 RepID=UPI00404933E3